MDKNISYCQGIKSHIPPDSLALYINKIQAAAKGNISAPQYVMADAGTATYSAFIFDEKTNRHKQVLIKTYSDILTTNSSPEAEQIYQRMVRIRTTPRHLLKKQPQKSSFEAVLCLV